MKTSLSGKPVMSVLVVGLILSAALGLSYAIHKSIEQSENRIVLTKDKWHCFVGILHDDSQFECMIYKRKDANFGQHPNNRHREHNKEQGSSIHSVQ